MSSFPPKQWAVRYLHDMDKMQCTERTEPGIYMETFLAARPAKGQEGTFRFVLYGPEKVKLRFPVNTVLTSGLFAGMVVEVEVDIRDHIRLEKNSVCSKWMDVLELVQSQDMLILDGLGEDASEEFIAAMAGFKKDVLQETGSTDKAGISFRRLVGTLKGQTEVLLMAQVHNICNYVILSHASE